MDKFRGSVAPFKPAKPLLGENLQLKPMHSVSAYFLTSDKAISTKLDQNIKQIELYTNLGTKGAWLRSRELLLNFGTPSMSLPAEKIPW